MPVFDQCHQQVIYQYNAAGNINFGATQNTTDFVGELKKLRTEFDKAVKARALSRRVAIDAKYNLDKAIVEAEETKPNKKAIEQYLSEAKALIQGITAAVGLVEGLLQAIEIVRGLL